MWLKSVITFIESLWTKFESWVARVTPGIKTRLVTGLGAIGSVAALGQQYITNLPMTKFITAEQITVATAIMFTLAFWFRGIGDRVQARDIQASPKALENA